ncbi:MAG: ABC transporter permease [Woronichinia naegeliana WA131]|jgi:ABC-type transport system involved in multi-copper enzyme maturation permease subunit|uniref:ABC transporter permease n=1 Tax=Woronichinia naegeliana WA131 TaxID=2824559 RepID=A0A977PW18_9CYAN|nr:MAG: ABC transporter permease [Woronichinia naegeliana WA131]
MNFFRIWAIAANGFREVIRDRILYVIGFFAILMALALRLLPEISVGADGKIFLDLGLAATSLLGAIIAIFVGTGLINKEIEKRTVLVLIPKPISRTEFIIGKHLGLSAVLAVMIAAMTIIYLLMLLWAKIPFSLTSILISQTFLLLELAVLTAVAILFGVFTSSILATLFSFGVYFMGHISRDLLKLGAITKNANIETLTRSLYLVLPNLERFNLKNDAVYGLLPSTTELLSSALYGFLYIVLLLTFANLIFARRQF